jgi:multidrug efflux pump subunit AcrA (membrane-fusion protein)
MSKHYLALLVTHLVTLSFWHSTVMADPMSVSTLQLNQSESYDLERVYGGQLKHQRKSDMGFETAGVIGEVHVNEGDPVEMGDALVTLDQATVKAQLEGAMA